MTPSDQSQDESVFHAARELADTRQRAAFLDFACGGDRARRARIEALFAAQAQAEAFFSQGPQDPAFSGRRVEAQEPAGESRATAPLPRVTGFKVLQRIAEENDGTVYMAEQTKPLRRRVALKVLHPSAAQRPEARGSDAAPRVFPDHPNIAHVLVSGTTESGQHYVVSELIRGLPITEYCEAHALAPGPRLELFGQVCAAVEHAHRHRVAHGNLTPSHILVTVVDGSPVVKVTDFDRASVTGAADRLASRTDMAAFDPSSDIAALGRLLDQIHAGHPFERTELDRLVQACRGDDPRHRSGTAAELAKAARRLLGFDPESISPAGRWGSWGNRLRRRPLQAAAIIALVGMLGALIAFLAS